MKKYCFDTSGISNPLETMPEDIHKSMWSGFPDRIEAGIVAATTEIHGEMCHIPGTVGACLITNKASVVLEVGEASWSISIIRLRCRPRKQPLYLSLLADPLRPYA